MVKYDFSCFVNYVLALPNGDIKFFRKRLEQFSVNQSATNYFSVSFCFRSACLKIDVFVNDVIDMGF